MVAAAEAGFVSIACIAVIVICTQLLLLAWPASDAPPETQFAGYLQSAYGSNSFATESFRAFYPNAVLRVRLPAEPFLEVRSGSRCGSRCIWG